MIIAIDLGSNTIRVGLFKFENGLCILEKGLEFIVGSARGLKPSMLITDEALERIYKALDNIVKEFDFSKFKHIAVATAAFRIAKNTDEIFAKIKARFGINFDLISGESEARIINLAILNALDRLKIDKTNSVFLDLGGASTEISDGENFKSFKFGIISFYETYKTAKNLEKNAKFISSEAVNFINSLKKDKVILTAGVATTMAALKLGLNYQNYDANKISGTILSYSEFNTIRESVLNLSKDEAEVLVGKDRQMLIVAGISLLIELLKDADATLIAIDDGLREGLAVSYFKGMFDKMRKF